jgi:hypothetical protein
VHQNNQRLGLGTVCVVFNNKQSRFHYTSPQCRRLTQLVHQISGACKNWGKLTSNLDQKERTCRTGFCALARESGSIAQLCNVGSEMRPS